MIAGAALPVLTLAAIVLGGAGAGFLEAASSRDEITGGFRFVSPASKQKERWKVNGEEAIFVSDEIVEITGVHAVIGDVDKPEYEIRTPRAKMNRTTRAIWSKAHVEIIKGNSRLTGTGFIWDPAKKMLTILSRVRMDLELDELKEENSHEP